MSEKLQQVILDPAAVALPGRLEVALMGSGLEVAKDGLDFGDAEFKQFLSEGEYGSRPIDGIWPSVTVKIPLIIRAGEGVSFDDWRLKLEQKVADFNLDGGGQIKRVLPSGRFGYADITGAKLHLGAGWAAENVDFDREAVLELQRLPDWYGEEVEGAVHEFTGDGSFTEIVKGTLPARVSSLKVEDKSGNDQLGLGWAFRAKNYDSTETAAWAYEAEAMTPLDAAAEVELSGASNGKSLCHNSLSTEWTPVLSTNLRSGTFLTHKGVYDVWARVYTTSGTLPWLRLLYDVGDIIAPNDNPQVQIPGSSAFYLVNFGQINLTDLPFGEQRWEGIVQARTEGSGTGENVYVDRLYFFCADESSGIPSATPTFQTPLTGYKVRDNFNQAEHTLNEQPLNAAGIVSGPNSPETAEDSAGTGTIAWTNPANAKASDGKYAEAALTAGQTSHYLLVKKLGFALPEGSVVVGIKASVGKHPPLSGGIEDHSVKIVKAGAVTGTEHRTSLAWPSLDTTTEYGSETDLWGTTWTAAQINAEGFGLAISVNALKSATACVDAATITVYYTEGATLKWASTEGDAVDLTIVSASHAARRQEVSDADINTGRYAIAGTTAYTNILAGIKCKREASAAGAGERVRQGALTRYTNKENWLMGCFDWINESGSGEDSLRILKRKAGAVTEPFKVSIATSTNWRYVWIEVDTHGRVMVWAQLEENGSAELIGVIFDTDLAEGGALASGKAGFYDAKTGATKNTRWYDSFAAWVPSHDAAIFAKEDARLSTNGMWRKSQDGKSYGPIAYPGSDLPRLPVSGSEENLVEIALKPSRGDMRTLPDSGLDKHAAQLVHRPCFSSVPSS